jgi:hypothetical protein
VLSRSVHLMNTDSGPPDKPPPSPPLDGDTGDSPPDQPDEREGATDREVGDLTGPGAGYDNEPEQEKDRGGVS